MRRNTADLDYLFSCARYTHYYAHISHITSPLHAADMSDFSDASDTSDVERPCLTVPEIARVLGIHPEYSLLYSNLRDHLIKHGLSSQDANGKFLVSVRRIASLNTTPSYNPFLGKIILLIDKVSVYDVDGCELRLSDTAGRLIRQFLEKIKFDTNNLFFKLLMDSGVKAMFPSASLNRHGSPLADIPISTLISHWSAAYNESSVYPTGSFGAEFTKTFREKLKNHIKYTTFDEPVSFFRQSKT